VLTHHLGTNFWEKNLGCLAFPFKEMKACFSFFC